mgnify:CR=1 FL=1
MYLCSLHYTDYSLQIRSGNRSKGMRGNAAHLIPRHLVTVRRTKKLGNPSGVSEEAPWLHACWRDALHTTGFSSRACYPSRVSGMQTFEMYHELIDDLMVDSHADGRTA